MGSNQSIPENSCICEAQLLASSGESAAASFFFPWFSRSLPSVAEKVSVFNRAAAGVSWDTASVVCSVFFLFTE
jgi:hypothetical protein